MIKVSGLRMDAEEKGRMSRSTRGRGNIDRYAYIIVYKLNQGRNRRKDVPFHKRGEGGSTWPQEKEGCPVPQGGGRGKHPSLCQNSCEKNEPGPVPQGETYGRRKDVSLHTGGKENFIVMPKKLF